MTDRQDGFSLDAHLELLKQQRMSEKEPKQKIDRRPVRSSKLTTSITRLSEHVGENTATMLAWLGWNWNELSRKSDVGSSFIYAIKNKNHLIGTTTVARIADALMLPPEWMFMPSRDFDALYAGKIGIPASKLEAARIAAKAKEPKGGGRKKAAPKKDSTMPPVAPAAIKRAKKAAPKAAPSNAPKPAAKKATPRKRLAPPTPPATNTKKKGSGDQKGGEAT